MPNRVVSFAALRARKVRGTDVKQGATLYAIQNMPSGLYFVWCYTDKAQAEYIASVVLPGNATDICANWRTSKAPLVPSDRKRA